MKFSHDPSFTFQYAFIGTGKFLRPIILALLESGCKLSRVLIVAPRPGLSPKLQWFKDNGCTVVEYTSSHTVNYLSSSKCIIPIVAPKGIGSVFALLRKVKFENKPKQHAILLTSGVTPEMMKPYCGLPENRIAVATGTTNCLFSLGLFAYYAANDSLAKLVADSLHPFGMLFREDTVEQVLDSISVFGGDNGIVARTLAICYKAAYGNDMSKLMDWLMGVKQNFGSLEGYMALLPENKNQDILAKHLEIKISAYQHIFGYDVVTAKERVYRSLISTADTLIKKGVTSLEDIETHFEGVATKDGITEKGAVKFSSAEDLLSNEKVIDVYRTMKDATRGLIRVAETSINDVIKTDDAISASLTGKYGDTTR